MTTAPARETVLPRLDTTDWALARGEALGDAGTKGPEPVNPGQYGLGDQKGGPGHEDVDGQTVYVDTTSPVSHPRDSMGSMSSDMLEELRKIIKEEVAQVTQVTRLMDSETGTSIDASRMSPPTFSQSSDFTLSYPSSPPSVVGLPDNSKTSSSGGRSGEAAYTDIAPPTSAQPPVSRSAPPITTPHRAVHFRSRGLPVIHCQPRVDPDSISPTTAIAPQTELNSVDKAWGVLFDPEGYPTQRLNSILRGLANFMVTEFQTESLVVTPEKMLVLYTRYKIEGERFPYENIFKSSSKDALERVEFLYQDLDCQYHLVQTGPRSHPNIPGLTPVGFAKWMVSNILAYPDLEARRLHNIMSELPVNVDGPLVNGKAERLPKQLSRRLLPESHDRKVRKILDEAIWDCLEDVTPALPAISRSKSDAKAPEANTHSRRSLDERKRPEVAPHRSYDRGNQSRVIPRTNSDAGTSLSRHHRDLPPPPMGRHSIPSRRSPPLVNKYSASLPAIPQYLPRSSAAQLALDTRGGETNYSVHAGRDRGVSSTYESPRSSGAGRRGGGDRGPTWEEVYSREGARVSSVDAEGSLRSFR